MSTLLVFALHAIGWQLAVAGWPVFAGPRAGVHWLELRRSPAGAPPAEAIHAAREMSLAAPLPVPRPPQARSRAPWRRAGAPRVVAGEGGARMPAAPAAPAWPVYPTQAPPPAVLHYALVQGESGASTPTASANAGGRATLEWTHDATSFSLRLTVTATERPPREWQSSGNFDAAGVAPLRLLERARGRDRRAINFDRDHASVRFSGVSATLLVAPGAQDRWSWIAQLASIAEAAATRGHVLSIGTRWDLQVAGWRGELDRWTFQVVPPGDPPANLVSFGGNDLSSSGEQAPVLLHVLRPAERPYDMRIEAWLSPSLHHFPAVLRMSTPPGPWSITLWRCCP